MIVKSLFYYPIKSCKGIPLAKANLDQYGIEGDREYTLVAPDGTALTQRENARLALVEPQLVDGILQATYPDRDPLLLEDPTKVEATVDLHGWQLPSVDMGDRAARWFTEAVGSSCRLAKSVGTWDFTDHKVYPEFEELSGARIVEQSRFNPFPILIVNESSLADLRKRQSSQVSVERFRPNIVLEGADAYEEDHWRNLQIGSVRLDIAIPCERCPMINVDQDTAESSKEPLATLASYRRIEKGFATKVAFGSYAAVTDDGHLSCGDEASARRTT